MAGGFFSLVNSLASQDFFTGVLPFIVTFSVFYLSLRRVPLFTDGNGDVTEKGNQLAALISVSVGFFVARFMVQNPFYQDFFITFFGKTVVGIVGLLGLLTLLGFIGFDFGSDYPSMPLIGVAVAIAGAAFASSGGFGPPIRGGSTQEVMEIIALIFNSGAVWLAIALGAILYVASGEGNGEAGGGDNGSDD